MKGPFMEIFDCNMTKCIFSSKHCQAECLNAEESFLLQPFFLTVQFL